MQRVGKKWLVIVLLGAMLVNGAWVGPSDIEKYKPERPMTADEYLRAEYEKMLQLCGAVEQVCERQEVEYVLGEYTEEGYISNYAKYIFLPPERCVLATQEEVLLEAGYNEKDIKEKYEQVMEEYVQREYVTDLYAYYPETGSNIHVTAEGVSKEVTSSWQAIYSLVKALRKDPEEVNRVQYGDLPVEIAGEEYEKGVIKFTLEKDEMVLCREFYVNCKNSVLKCITIEYVEGNESERDALIGAFSQLY